MNKELIKQYKAEFDHWLNGGSLLAKHPNDQDWYEATNPSFSSINISYVINDEYSAYRKALAEGKAIEVLHYTGYKELDQNPWRLFAIGLSNFDKPAESYRIKPEEPQFKVGDWVLIKNKATPVRLTKKHLDSLPDCIFYDVGIGGIHYPLEDVEHWKPKLGEWCWVSTNGTYSLYQYNSTSRSTHDLEPFIGTLPTHLQQPE